MSGDNSFFSAVAPLISQDVNFTDALITGSLSMTASGPTTFFKTPTGSLLGLYGVAAVAQPTSSISPVVVAGTGSGNIVSGSTTFGGYTIAQVVAALQATGILA